MESPFLLRPTLSANGKAKTSSLNLLKTRTVSVTVRVTYDSSATAGARVNVYFSPDGTKWDTKPYAYFDVDFVAGDTRQETALIDVPEHGKIIFEVENLDSAQSLTAIHLWVTIQSWSEGIRIDKDTVITGGVNKDEPGTG